MTVLLRKEAVAEKLLISKSMVWKLQRTDATFPRGIKLSPRCTVWDEAELDEWIKQRKEKRNGSHGAQEARDH